LDALLVNFDYAFKPQLGWARLAMPMDCEPGPQKALKAGVARPRDLWGSGEIGLRPVLTVAILLGVFDGNSKNNFGSSQIVLVCF
jgi:hypothetical protein